MMNIKSERANGNHMRSNVCFDNFDDEMLRMYSFVWLFVFLCMCVFINVSVWVYTLLAFSIFVWRANSMCVFKCECIYQCLCMCLCVCVSKCIFCEKIVSIMYISFHWIESVSSWYTKSSSFSCSQVEINQKQNNNKKPKEQESYALRLKSIHIA